MSRKLATIKKIEGIEEIPTSDFLCSYVIGGWRVVDKIGKYVIGELVIMVEIDSWVPHALAPFLTEEGKEPKVYNNVPGQRLRTKKLRGVISQGLILDTSVLDHVESELMEGLDVSAPLGIQKWEPPAEFLAANAKGNFPSFIPKTDQERIQNIKRSFEDYQRNGNSFEVTEKLHGSSMTVYINEGQIGVCSRNLDLKEDEGNTFWATAKSSGAIALFTLKQLNGIELPDMALQGELCGPGINGNQYGLSDFQFFIFDIFVISEQRYMLPQERIQTIRKINELYGLDLKHVPILGYFQIDPAISMQDFLKTAEGKSVINASNREGLVFKSETSDESFKVISNSWLLKNE